MIAVFFFYGLSFFCLGLAALLETQRVTDLPLGKPLAWLAAFGFAHGTVEWIDMFLLTVAGGAQADGLMTARAVLLPLSAITLVRFGIGLIHETRPLPAWLNFIPAVLLVPAALLVSYALIVFVTEPPLYLAADIWSRYLLYLPGCLLAAFGFFRQRRELGQTALRSARPLLLGAAIAFLLNAIAAGLIVPQASYGLAPWLNYGTFQAVTGFPVQLLRMFSALIVTILVIRSMGVFETEHRQHLRELEAERQQAQKAALETQHAARLTAENWTEALVNVSRQIANMENVDPTLLSITDYARVLLDSDAAALGLWDEEKETLVLKCYASLEETRLVDSTPVQSELITKVARSVRSFRFPEDLEGQSSRWICPLTDQEVRAAAIVSLQLDGNPVGGLWVSRFTNRPFTAPNLIDLERLADQAVIAIEHALMASHLQSLAVIEERGRIAREMHDSLAQILGYLNLELQTLAALVNQGETEATLDALSQARRRVQAAHADVRENILSLRTTLSSKVGVIPALKEYVDEFGLQTGIQVEVENQAGEHIQLSPLVETQLVRIIQEALANVRKHAQARRAWVRLLPDKGCLRAAVIDDGVGFGHQPPHSRFGLETMRERAESVGGSLTVTSQAGGGTQVEVQLPMLEV